MSVLTGRDKLAVLDGKIFRENNYSDTFKVKRSLQI